MKLTPYIISICLASFSLLGAESVQKSPSSPSNAGILFNKHWARFDPALLSMGGNGSGGQATQSPVIWKGIQGKYKYTLKRDPAIQDGSIHVVDFTYSSGTEEGNQLISCELKERWRGLPLQLDYFYSYTYCLDLVTAAVPTPFESVKIHVDNNNPKALYLEVIYKTETGEKTPKVIYTILKPTLENESRV